MSDFLSISFNTDALKIDYEGLVEKDVRADTSAYTPVGGKIFQSTRALFEEKTTRDLALDMLEVRSVDQSFYEAQNFAVNFLNACDKIDADQNTNNKDARAVHEHMEALRKAWVKCQETMGSFQRI